MATSATLDIFIAHGWSYHDEWNRLVALLDNHNGLRWRNFSVPWHDPFLTVHTPEGRARIERVYEAQVVPCKAVVLLEAMWQDSRLRSWMELAVQLAQKHQKPLLVIHANAVPAPDLTALGGILLPWNEESILATLQKVAL